MKRRNLIKSLVGASLTGPICASQTKEKIYFNYLDVVGNQIFASDYSHVKAPTLYDIPRFINCNKDPKEESYSYGLDVSTNIQVFSNKNDANKFVSELIDKQKTDTLFSKYILSEHVDRRASTLVINSNRTAIFNRRGPANEIITSSDIQYNVEYAILNNSSGSIICHYGPSIHVNENKSNTIEMFYKGVEKWDAPLAYKILSSGEIEVHISPGFDRSVRKVLVV
jgi:hypothetical protein